MVFFFSFFLFFLSFCCLSINFSGELSMNLSSFYSPETFLFFVSLTIIFFSIIFFSFGVSMVLLIFHNSIFFLFLAWDGLGVSSFFLVAYYMNWDSVNGAMVTVLTNRFGDFCLFWFFSSLVFSPLFYLSVSAPILLILGASTKSAQFPFCSWLPLAMAAPTPVSALVHSSTLVTAGVFILIRYFQLLEQKFFLTSMFYLGIFTIFVAGLSSIVEMDLKKIIALSTLSQMGFLIMSLGLMMPNMCFFHLITHAFFKSCLFVQIGSFIVQFWGNQDSRFFSSVFSCSPLSCFYMNVCVFSLCGISFLSGFFSKEAILLLFSSKSFSLAINFIVWFSVCLTFLYSLRIFWGVSSSSAYVFFSKSSLSTSMSSLILLFFGSFGGYFLQMNSNWISLLPISGENTLPIFIYGGSMLCLLNWSNFSSIFQKMLFVDTVTSGITIFSKKSSKIMDMMNLSLQKSILYNFLGVSTRFSLSSSSNYFLLSIVILWMMFFFC